MSSTEGRVALVTGGAGGIGAAICRRLDALGHQVVVVDVDADAAREVAGRLRGGVSYDVDLAEPTAIVELASAASRDLGRVDVLVNNAGVAVVERFLDADEAGWEQQWQVNLRAPLQLTKVLLPGMVERRWGRLIYISSDGARAGSAGEAVYAACKAGLLGFAKSIAREVARDGITANAVCPGPTDTPMLRAIEAENPRLVQSLQKAIPLGRLAVPDDVAGIVAFLSSDDAGYLTGQTYSVSGGITMC